MLYVMIGANVAMLTFDKFAVSAIMLSVVFLMSYFKETEKSFLAVHRPYTWFTDLSPEIFPHLFG